MTAPKDPTLAEEEALILELAANYFEARRRVNLAVSAGASPTLLVAMYEQACLVADELLQYDEALEQ